MAIMNKELNDAVDAWPLDNEQKKFLENATSGLQETKASELANLLREAEFAVVDCVASLGEMVGVAYAAGSLAPNGDARPASPAALSQRLNDFRWNIDRFLEGIGQDVSTGSQFPSREPISDFRTTRQPPELGQLVLELVTLAQARQSSIAHGSVRASDLERAPAPSQPEMTPDERAFNVAKDLAYDALTRSGARRQYEFRHKNVSLVLRMEIAQLPSEEIEALYVSLNPPGENCLCCGGTGKRPTEP
jgi:hypothetical protein